ncbi:hypothetical protein O6H91_01G073400 [Diphasiastrum complanatum]|uniref:Uncharacterized protein n=1 Tax=Diphasiastrum complanatum TaxID=34168 RepID=A0ACC2ES97_DIPCM|nr:hypothetical protein O6H91_01G073400 [Diphasiastrum complanatum]
MGGTEAFPELGSHCSYESCNQLDFLPFKCDCCSQMFCLDHRSYMSHNCPKGDLKDVSVVLCPACASAVRKVFGEDPNLTLEKHMSSNCDPSNYDKVMKKPKCPVKGCHQALTISNKFHCKGCSQDICLKHRFPVDHTCRSAFKGRRNPSKLSEALKFLDILEKRGATDCASSSSSSAATSSSVTSTKSVSAH